MRRPIIAGNWKMNKTPYEAVELINQLKHLVKDAEAEVVVCPPFVCLPAIAQALRVQILPRCSKICTLKKKVHLQER